jgi:hypothetical protein
MFLSEELKQTDTAPVITWVKKEEFNPIEGEWYWVIIPNELSRVGFYVPYSAMYVNGKYKQGEEGEQVEIDNANISHVAKIVYP